MVTSPLLTTIFFPFLHHTPAPPAPAAAAPSTVATTHPKSRFHASPDGKSIKYEVTIIRWTEFLHTGEQAAAGVYLDFGETIEGDNNDQDCCSGADWEEQDYDDDAVDWEDGNEEEVWASERVRRRDDWEGVDVWRTRLGG